MPPKKSNIDTIPLIIFSIVVISLISAFYYGVLYENRTKNIQEGKKRFFSVLDQIAIKEEPNSETAINAKRVFQSINRNDKLQGELILYGYQNVLEDYYTTVLNGDDSLKLKKQDLALFLMKSGAEGVCNSENIDNPYYSELSVAIKSKDFEGAQKYLEEIINKEIESSQKLVKLKKRNLWTIPISAISIFFVFFYGIHSVKKRK